MGNCCGKQDSGDKNFQGEGRTLGANPTSAPVSSSTKANLPSKIPPAQGGSRTSESAGPRQAAARAAEERANAAGQGKGKLGRQLDAQKAQTQTDTLAQAARENVATREADAAAQARNYE